MATAVFGEGYAHTLWVAPTYVMGKNRTLYENKLLQTKILPISYVLLEILDLEMLHL